MNIFSKCSLVILTLAILPTFATAQWQPFNSAGQGMQHLLYHQDKIIGYNGGGISYSTDWGRTWTTNVSTIGNAIEKLVAEDSVLYAKAYGAPDLYRSFDWGASWQPFKVGGMQYPPYDFEVVNDYIYCFDTETGNGGPRIFRAPVSNVQQVDTLFTPYAIGNLLFFYPKMVRRGDDIFVGCNLGFGKITTPDTCTCMQFEWLTNAYWTGNFMVSGDTIAAMTAQGWVRSFDGGTQWELLGGPELQLSWMGTADGKILRQTDTGPLLMTADGGATWDTLFSNAITLFPPQPRGALRLNDRWYVAAGGLLEQQPDGRWLRLSGYNGGSNASPQIASLGPALYRSGELFSFDGGATWAGPLKHELGGISNFVNWVEKDGRIYAITEYGQRIYSAHPDSLFNWQLVGYAPPGVHYLAVYHDTLVVFPYDQFPKRLHRSADGITWEPMAILEQDYVNYSEPTSWNDRLFRISTSFNALPMIVSVDGGVTWQNAAFNTDFSPIQGPSAGFADGGSILYWYDHTRIMGSTDGGLTWTKLNITLLNDDGSPAVIAQLAAKDGVAYAMTNENLFQSVGMTGSWWNITGNLPSSDANLPFYGYYKMAIHGDHLYAAAWQWMRRAIAPNTNAGAQGFVFFDLNQNGQQDAGEPPLSGIGLQAGAQTGVSGINGQYACLGQLSDVLHPVFTNPYYVATPSEWLLAAPDSLKNFAVTILPGVTDWQADLTPQTPFRPGFTASLQLKLKNIGSTTPDGRLLFLPHPDLVLLGAEPPVSGMDGDTLWWNIDTLVHNGATTIQLHFQTPVTAMLGDTLSCYMAAEPALADSTPLDNVVLLQGVVVGAYDPNDKTALQGAEIPLAELTAGRPLDYTIRFQNTGNLPALQVRILDTLDAAFDPASLEIVDASWPCQWSLAGNRVVQFMFPGLVLPDSISNEPGSHGFVRYRIKARNPVAPGTTLRNTAHIFFDYNPAVTTNTTETLVTSTIATLQPLTGALDLWPNPASDRVTVQIPFDDPYELQVYAANGRMMARQSVYGARAIFSVVGWPAGVYRVQVSSRQGISEGQLIVAQ